jgi:hypothetical protein
MGPIKDLKGVQRVMGCLAALSRFILRLGERGLPLYRLLRKAERFTWTPEAEEALGNLKALLTNAPILVPLALGEALLIYVAVTTQVVSAAIVVERREEGHALLVQRPVYFISEVLSETKIRYPQVQKLLYAVILTRRKLRHYFESHPVTVVSSFSLGEIIQCREASGRIAKWAVELMGETISFAPRKAIKSQDLADFCDTPGVYFGLCQKNYPNLGCSVKISISRSRMSLIIQIIHSHFTEFRVTQSHRRPIFGAC